MSVASDLLVQAEQEFTELKKNYTLFLCDQLKTEPYELREQLLRNVKRLRNLSNLRTEEQFRTNNLISKVQSHIQLWDRQLERKYAGKGPARPKPTQAPPAQEQERSAPNKTIVIRDTQNQRSQVEELYDEYMRLNLILGGRKMANFAKFQSFIEGQTQKVQGSQPGAAVRYEVMVQEDKVVIKSKLVKD